MIETLSRTRQKGFTLAEYYEDDIRDDRPPEDENPPRGRVYVFAEDPPKPPKI